jgi:hypothetical protein
MQQNFIYLHYYSFDFTIKCIKFFLSCQIICIDLIKNMKSQRSFVHKELERLQQNILRERERERERETEK